MKISTLVDPANITNYHRDRWQLEAFLLFAIAVAGHSAKSTLTALDRLFEDCYEWYSPFDWIKGLNEAGWLMERVTLCGVGNILHNQWAFLDAAYCGYNLRTVTIEELERLHKVGMKTSRFFVQHSRGEKVAALDTHLLKWLNARGIAAPAITPGSPTVYRRLEKVFLQEAEALKIDPATLDLQIWRYYAGHSATLPGALV